jgi:dipeptidyl aminopeptidase/acylaminoacyl peptidase
VYVLLEPATGKQWSLPNETGEAACWEPEGRSFIMAEILFESTTLLDDYPSSHLLRYDIPASGEAGSPVLHDLTQDVTLEDTSPVYAPDGSQLAFARKYLDLTRWSPGRQLWVMSPDGQQARQLTDDLLYNHYGFAWSTDGQQIAFVRFHQTVLTLPPELWVIQADGSNPVQLVIGGYAPRWVP